MEPESHEKTICDTGEWETGIQEGYRTKTVRFGNCTARIHRPILTPEEQARREEEVKLAILGISSLEGRPEERKNESRVS